MRIKSMKLVLYQHKQGRGYCGAPGAVQRRVNPLGMARRRPPSDTALRWCHMVRITVETRGEGASPSPYFSELLNSRSAERQKNRNR